MEKTMLQENYVDKDQQIQDLNRQIEKLIDEINKLNETLTNIQTSRSWRITAPLRQFAQYARDNPSMRFLAKGFKYFMRNGISATWQKAKALGGVKAVLQKIFRKE